MVMQYFCDIEFFSHNKYFLNLSNGEEKVHKKIAVTCDVGGMHMTLN